MSRIITLLQKQVEFNATSLNNQLHNEEIQFAPEYAFKTL